MDVTIMPVDLLRLKVESRIEDFAPEYAYDCDMSVFTGAMFDIAIARDFVDEWKIVDQLTDKLFYYGDSLPMADCREMVMSSLRIVEAHVAPYLNRRVRSWRWLDYNRNNIIILSGDDE